MINLFTSHYPEKNKHRANELQECLLRNAYVFDQIFVICEGNLSYAAQWPIEKVHTLPINTRPTYRSFFNAINHCSNPGDINVLANSDIYFEALPPAPEANTVYALTRYEPDGTFLNRRDSQDSWIFNGHVLVNGYFDFPMGICGCDNRIAYELHRAGYIVTNPSLSIKTYHLHAGEKSYDKSDPNCPIVKPPYLRLDPCRL